MGRSTYKFIPSTYIFISEIIEKKNVSGVITLLEELGGWPLLGDSSGGNWDQKTFDFEKLLIVLSKYYNTPIIPCWVGLDDRNNTRRIIFVTFIKIGSLLLNSEF